MREKSLPDIASLIRAASAALLLCSLRKREHLIV
jgi:hypothetical protein